MGRRPREWATPDEITATDWWTPVKVGRNLFSVHGSPHNPLASTADHKDRATHSQPFAVRAPWAGDSRETPPCMKSTSSSRSPAA